jgi:hypothetical protein
MWCAALQTSSSLTTLPTLSRGNSVSLLGKYLPSENASSPRTITMAHFWIRALYGLARYSSSSTRYNRIYRKKLSQLRARIDIVERKMSAGRWSEIDYSTVPSRAMYIYRKAFMRHDPERFTAYLASVKAGKSKINAGVMYPYEILGKLVTQGPSETLDLMWGAMPDYFSDQAGKKVICVCDTSGSMLYNGGMPYYVATSLTMYAAERMTGMFADTAITFSANPQFVTIRREASLRDRYMALSHGSGYNTNFQAVLDLILDTAVRAGIAQDQMPDIIMVISDMQFDQADGSAVDPYGQNKKLRNPTNFEAARAKYAAAGYTMPRFVMWNVRAAADQPVQMTEPGVFLVSGLSSVIFKQALALDTSITTPMDAMMQTLRSDRLMPVWNALEAAHE